MSTIDDAFSVPQGQRGRSAVADPRPDDPLTRLLAQREAQGQALIQPGGMGTVPPAPTTNPLIDADWADKWQARAAAGGPPPAPTTNPLIDAGWADKWQAHAQGRRQHPGDSLMALLDSRRGAGQPEVQPQGQATPEQVQAILALLRTPGMP
jgi:hypothetical protein